MSIIRSDKGSRQYIVNDTLTCEYKDEMKKYHLKPLVSDECHCTGLKNKYNGKASTICIQCAFYKEEIK